MKGLNGAALVILIIGGLNWGLVGLFDWNLVEAIFSGWAPVLARLIYIVVGIAAVYSIYLLKPVTAFEDRKAPATTAR